MGKTEREGERGRQRGEEARKREERYKWKRAAHLPDGSSGRAQRAAMAVSQYGAPPPDCHTAANTNSAITLLVCVCFALFPLAHGGGRQHMVVKETELRDVTCCFFFGWLGNN